jgi:LuxR family maltose regulon positive regulatory protein
MPRKSGKNTPVILSGVLYTNDEHTGLRVGNTAWWNWLRNATGFYYQTDMPFTARPEKRRQGIFWYAYRRSQGKLYKGYLGAAHQLTDERLAEVARQLAGKIAHSAQ